MPLAHAQVRPLVSADFDTVTLVVDDWWGGRAVRHLLPRLFFEHFSPTSFAIEEAGELRAFLVGFQSPAHPHMAYIHFVGVSPLARGKGHGRLLYERFFERVAALGCTEVQCITAPINQGSIAFHRAMGFELLNTGAEVDGVPVCLNHGGEGQHKVVFRKVLAAGEAGA